MQGKRGVIMGVANERSLAWGIAAACAAQGAETRVHLPGRGAREAGAAAGRKRRLDRCSRPATSATTRASTRRSRAIGEALGPSIDFLVHAIGFADKQYLRGRYVDTPRAAFLQALDISCYSFTAVARRAAAMMPAGGSLLTLTYLGAERVVPHYNVMGVAKAALEASVRYLAADLGVAEVPGERDQRRADPHARGGGGIGDFRYILRWNQLNAPLERNVTIEDVGGAGVYLLSDLAARRHRRGASRRLRLSHGRA